MRETIEQKKKKKGAWICAVVVIAAATLYLGVALIPIISESFGDGFVVMFAAIYILLIAALIIGILIALRLRLKEIEGGEEEDAKKY